MTQPTAEEHKFIGHLKWLLEQKDRSAARAAMAHLRRGLGKPPGTVFEMDPYVLKALPEKTTLEQEAAYYIVAALFAHWHQGKDKTETLMPPTERGHTYETDVNLGRSLHVLADRQTPAGSSRDEAEKRVEKRLNALLNANPEDLSDSLRRVVSLLKAKDVPVNWAQLLHDIQHWDAESRFVQHDWAKGFWITGQERSQPGNKE